MSAPIIRALKAVCCAEARGLEPRDHRHSYEARWRGSVPLTWQAAARCHAGYR